ncbi:JDVT-CTERM system glutamic-type intramembrane protease MrtJ [Limisalsivibrio acetivorans]|uniref:JDVT-CTERM system glutamic-type intramembrane protease MrtJ n=1 Tax=Limisalsivibrio acetivorans TaxID=1304888 RepID=UPI0003B7BBD2|nr:JDVT-CTERM system glutamic-type intramembrane protease [Limisalsivibrio acetivorans]
MKRERLTAAAFIAGLSYFAFRIIFTGAEFRFDGQKVFHFLILAPVAEELFFRGVVQDYAERRINGGLWGLTYGNLGTSVLFSAMHLITSSPLHSALVYIPSLIFGRLYTEYRSVYIPILIHSFYNLNVMIT